MEQLREVLRGKRRRSSLDPEAEGMLEGVRDEREREARIELIQQLAADGATAEEIKAAIDEDRLTLLPLERALAVDGEQRYTLAELAERSGVEEDYLRALRRALGLPRADSEHERISDLDLEAAERVRRYREAGMPDDGLLEIARVLGHGMSLLAATIRRVIADAYLEPGDTELEAAMRYAEAAAQLQPELGPVLEYALAVHEREQIGSEVVGKTELASGRLSGASDMTVCFADLVGFTQLGEEIAPDGLGAVAGRLTDLAVECARPPVRLVKMIGDAALLVSPDADELLRAALALVDAVERDEELPSLRVGMTAGPVITRGGEWYGTPVNRASRLTAAARSGQVWATREVRDAAAGAFIWSKVGRRKLRGVAEPVTVLEVRLGGLDGGEPWAGYDGQTVKAIRSALAESGPEFAARVLEYERAGKHRKGVLQAAKARAG